MKKKLLYGLGVLSLTVLVSLLVWQGSFSFGDFTPAGPQQVTIFWAVSTVVFLLTVLIGFLLFRTFVKIYLERQRWPASTGRRRCLRRSIPQQGCRGPRGSLRVGQGHREAHPPCRY